MASVARPRDAWRRHVAALMPELRARADDLCELCGRPIAFDAPARSSLSPSVDHVVPRQHGGAELPPLDELRLVHAACNTARGNRTRHARATPRVLAAVELDDDDVAAPRPILYAPAQRRRRRAPIVDDQARLFELDDDDDDSPIFRNETTRPTPAVSLPPKTPGFRRPNPDRVELVPPRLETPRPADVVGSYAPEAAAWIAHYLADELRPWQRYALERMLEFRDGGELRWRRVILTVSRQSGKSIASRGLCGWRVGAADIFGERQEVLHVANLRTTAARVWTPAARMLEATAGAVVRRANGQEMIELGDGSAWRLAASNLDGGVGSSVHLAFVDEAWRVSRDVVDGSIAPTMLETVSPQLVLCSTAGDGGSTLLLEDRDAAIAALAEPDLARTLLLEWSAPPDADPADRDAWRLASPHWTPRRLAALEHAYATTASESDWRRQYLNQWVLAARSWIAPGQWAAAASPGLELPASPPGTVAVNDQDGNPGACGYVLAVADDDRDRIAVAGRSFPTRRALWAALDELTAARRGLTLIHPASFERHVAQLRGVTAVKVGSAEQRAGYGPTLAAVVDGRLRHDGDDELTRQMLTATPVTVPDVGTMLSSKKSPGPIYLARAAVWAIGAELRPEQRPRALVVSG